MSHDTTRRNIDRRDVLIADEPTTALEEIATGEQDAARERLSGTFHTVCEGSAPPLETVEGNRTTARFRHDAVPSPEDRTHTSIGAMDAHEDCPPDREAFKSASPPSGMEWKPDWGLRGRMVLTMFLLFALYVVFLGVLSFVTADLLVIVAVMTVFLVAQFSFSDKLALYSMGAKEVSEDDYPQLHAMVSRLAQQADLPKPKVAVADSQVPNAFATGRSQKSSAVAVTTGIMRTLNEEELEGVIAHELAHIKNRDVMVMTIASFLSTIAFLVVRFGIYFGGGRNRNGGVIVAILASLVVWIMSFFLIRALSRYREFAADRGGAVITGQPSALASALLKISGRMDQVPSEDLRDTAEMNAFFIIPIKSGIVGRLFSTHPSTEKRVERLRQLEKELETGRP